MDLLDPPASSGAAPSGPSARTAFSRWLVEGHSENLYSLLSKLDEANRPLAVKLEQAVLRAKLVRR